MKVSNNITRFTCLTCAAIAGVLLIGCEKHESTETTISTIAPSEEFPIDLDVNRWPLVKSQVDKDPEIEAKVAELLATMTLEQKVAQMIQPEIRDVTVEEMRKYGFGSYLNGGGSFPNSNKHATAQDWIDLAQKMYEASIDDSLDGSDIPTMWGTDAVHGHNNVIGATIFPHNIGLGAANNPEMITNIAKATAQEVMATGIDWVFAPTVAVVRDDRWGRTYEGYSEDPEITRAYSAAIVEGLQGKVGEGFLGDDKVISTVKHFVGDGGTENGDDQGNNLSSEQQMIDIHAQGYFSGLEAGAQTVMASFNSWHGQKMHGNKYMLTDVLKDRLGFDGLIVGDWNGHGQIPGCSNASCPQAVNAGMDILMAPTRTWKPLYENTIAQVKSGEINLSRIDDAVTRILRVKMRAGIFDKPAPNKRPLAGKTELIGAAAHREIARDAVRQSLVLLKNKNETLPLKPNQKVFIAGDAANNIGKQSGGWTITWQGTNNENSDFPGGTSIFKGVKYVVEAAGGSVELGRNAQYKDRPDVAIVVYGEEPYAEGNGDLGNLEYQRGNKTDVKILQKLKADGIPVVSVFISGRAMWVNPELNASDAFVAAWLPGSEGAGVADVLFTDIEGDIRFDFTGKLSYSWPNSPDQVTVNRHDTEYSPLLPYGFGLTYKTENVLADNLSEDTNSSGEQVAPRELFVLGPKKPWAVQLDDGSTSEKMVSNVLDHGVISARTVDRNVQEDALQIDWSGGVNASVFLGADFPEDLREYHEAEAVLAFDVQRMADNTAPIYISLGSAAVELTQPIATLSSSEWKTLSVDLNCFAKQGESFDKVFSVFKMSTEGKLSVQISDVWLKTYRRSSADVVCD